MEFTVCVTSNVNKHKIVLRRKYKILSIEIENTDLNKYSDIYFKHRWCIFILGAFLNISKLKNKSTFNIKNK